MKHKKIALALAGILLAGNANADITFNGFANIVAGKTISSNDNLYGYDDNIDLNTDSLFALQASSDLGEGLTVTAQILSRGVDDWDPKFEWAYVAYQANDNLRILAGRQRVPFFMYSDFLDVSYTYPWIIPPEGVYNSEFNTFDGVGAIYSSHIGEFDTSLHVIYGGNDTDIDAETLVDLNDLVGTALTANREWLTLRAAYFQSEMNVGISRLNPLINGWESLGQNYIVDQIEASKDTASFVGLGFQLDFDNVIVIGEYTAISFDDTPIPNQDSYYVMAGYRFDNMMVHLTYGADEDIQDPIDIQYQISGIPDGTPVDSLPSDLQALIAGTTSLATTEKSTYITLGLRWDFHDSAALKFEYTSYNDDLINDNDAGIFRTALVTVF